MKTIRRKQQTISLRKAFLEDFLDLEDRFEGEPDLPKLCDGRSHIVSMGGGDVALVSYVTTESTLLLTQLFVYPSYRGFGIGTQVLELLGSLDGVDRIDVLATESSVKFYEKLGFESVLSHTIMSRNFK